MKNVGIAVGVVVILVGGIWLYRSSNQEGESAATNSEGITGSVVSFESVPTSSSKDMETGTYEADTEESSIGWEAGKPAIAGYVHHGSFGLQSGEVTLAEGELTGEFVIDVDSLRVTSLGGGKAGQESTLEGHLKGERFFDVVAHPTATFTITDVSPRVLPGPDQADYTASGVLTLKGQTNDVSFPMKVVVNDEDEVWVTAELEIDRTRWGIDFGSASIAERITENIIGDTVKLDLKVKLTK